jgi:aspartate kinase
MNADPRYFENASLLNQISYREAIELACANGHPPKNITTLTKKFLYIKSFINPLLGTSVSRGVNLDTYLASSLKEINC